jgi:hypothetical protein
MFLRFLTVWVHCLFVRAGDFAAIASEDAAARLFNSGAFANNRPLKKQVEKAYAEVGMGTAAELRSCVSISVTTTPVLGGGSPHRGSHMHPPLLTHQHARVS